MADHLKIRAYENLHILLWLLKDLCWLATWQITGLLIALPTITVAIHITWLHRYDRVERLHNFAVCFWICANITWMIGEFFFDDRLRPLAEVFFGLGLASLSVYYLFLLPREILLAKAKDP